MRTAAVFLIIAVLLFSVSCRKTEEPEEPEDSPVPCTGTEGSEIIVRFIPRTAYANWTEDDGIRDESLNRPDPVPGYATNLPIYVFNSEEDVKWFRDRFSGVLSMSQGYSEIPSFDEVTASYGSGFFEDNCLVLAYVTASSGTFRFGIRDMKVTDQMLVMEVVQTNDPEAYTDDMAGWFMMAEVPKTDIESCTGYEAFRVSGED